MTFEMRRMSLISALLVFLLLIGVACSGDDEPADPTEVADTTENEAATPTNEPTEEPTEVPTAAPTATSEPTAEPTAETIVPAYEAVYDSASCEFAEPAGFDIECGYLTVPENRSQLDNDRTVRLHVALFVSDNPDKAADPVIYLDGGPGGDALETVPIAFADRFGPFLADRDFIMFDQRGTGYSEPSLACPELIELTYETIELELTDEEGIAMNLEALAECRERLEAEGIDFSAYNSAENAADVNDLRIAMGYEEWNLFGISYGTRLAQTIVRDHPEGIRSVILDSAYPIESNLLTETPANLDRALTELFDGCAEDADCAAAYPDLATVFWDTAAALEVDLASINIIDFQNGDNYDSFIDGDGFIGIVFQGLYSAEIIPLLPQLIYDASQGEYVLIETLISAFLQNSEFISVGMQYAVQCNEEAVFTEPGSAAAAAAEFPALEGFFRGALNVSEGLIGICEDWGVSSAPAIENEAIRTDIPTIVMAGEYDPITPPSWGRQVAANLGNSYFAYYPGVGHGASISGECPLSMTMAFLNDPTVEPDDSCIAEMTSPDFSIAGEIAEITFTPYSNDQYGVAGAVPEGWEEIVDGVFVRGSSAADQTLVIFQGIPADLGEQFFLDLIEEQFQMEESPGFSQELAVGDLTWNLYRATGLGQQLDIATTEDGDVIVAIMMVSTESERDVLYETLFLPMIEVAMAQ